MLKSQVYFHTNRLESPPLAFYHYDNGYLPDYQAQLVSCDSILYIFLCFVLYMAATVGSNMNCNNLFGT